MKLRICISNLIFSFFLCFPSLIFAQIRVLSTSYSDQNGLGQNSVLAIAKDKSGMLWFATKDGLSRFDGVSFENYKVTTSQFHCSLNNQFTTLKKDFYENFWTINTMGQVFRFSTSMHKFDMRPNPEKNNGNFYFIAKQIKILNNGDIWILGSTPNAVRYRYINESELREYILDLSEGEKNTYINDVYRDSEGNTWLLTDHGLGMMRDNEEKMSHIFFEKEGEAFLKCTENNQYVLFSTRKGCVYTYEKINKRFSTILIEPQNEITSLFFTNERDVFLTLRKGGYATLNLADNNVKHSKNQNFLCEKSWIDKNGQVWIKEKGGNRLFVYDAEKDNLNLVPVEIDPFLLEYGDFSPSEFQFGFKDDNDIFWLLPDKKKANQWYLNDRESEKPFLKGITRPYRAELVFTDDMDVFWTGSQYSGIQKNVVLNSSFKFVQYKSNRSYEECNDVTAICCDRNNRIWVATKDKTIRLYDENNAFLGYITPSGKIDRQGKKFPEPISVIYEDRKGSVWVGTGRVLIKLEKEDNEFATINVELKEDVGSITDILEDSQGHIWATTDRDGLQFLKPNKNGYDIVNRHNGFRNSYPPTVLKTNCLYEDKIGRIWMGSSEGITVFQADFETERFVKFFFYNPENTDMQTSFVSDIYQDRDGILWFASFGGGLFCISDTFQLGDTPKTRIFNTENNKLNTDLLISLKEDETGSLWIIAENALLRFKKNKEEAESFGEINGLNHMGFSKHGFVRTKGNHFIVGSNYGFYDFSPSKIKKSEFSPHIVFTKFLLFNKEIEPQKGSVLPEDINLMTKIVLSHNQSAFSIDYSALDYRNPANIKYAYRLDNFEDNWNYVGNKRTASYTNLPPGTYTLRIKSTNCEGNWCANDRTIDIVVSPSFWQTIWAKILLFVLLGAIIGAIIYAYLQFYKMRTNMRLEQDMSSLKLQFFTDISHELRTPLTLISAPLEQVLQNSRLGSEDKELLEIVRTNVARMLRMLNQILDLRKLQTNKMRLKIEQTDMDRLIEKTCSSFDQIAQKRSIKFQYIDQTNHAKYWVDRELVSTIIFNLLSNAFKFTPSGKSITVFSKIDNDNNFQLKVIDQGSGIPSNKLKLIFERFVTLNNKAEDGQTGSGIGLSLVKEIVDLHHGRLEVKSEVGVGTEFTVVLLPGTEHFGQNVDIVISDDAPGAELRTESGEDSTAPENTNRTKILVIEDNKEMRTFISNVLSTKYKVVEAENGEEGLEQTINEMPDLVLTDIMMPVMDGVEYIKRLRVNNDISHIPVILLTAKTDLQSKLECLKLGANDYITKPFSMVYLETRIENILEEREKWQNEYRRKLLEGKIRPDNLATIGEPEDATENNEQKIESKPDDVFMQNFMKYVEENMENSDLSLDEISDNLKISRRNLTYKIKSLVGMSPIEFIKDMRLNKAAKLIDEGELNMTQITYMIGMTDSRYFSRVFKQKFHLTPTEYKNRQEKAE